MPLHQELEDQDLKHRVNFCNWSREKLLEDRTFFQQVIWCDEASFRNTGEVNRHNMRYWSTENPHWMREVNHQWYWSLNTWWGVPGDRIVGPYFFNETLNGKRYNNFILNELPNFLRDITQETRQRMWLVQDGAPPHFYINVRNTLDQMFPQK